MSKTTGAKRNARARASTTTQERRHSFRVQVPAAASVWHRGKLCGCYTVSDLSIGGCSLNGRIPALKDATVDVILHLPHERTTLLRARVCRVDESGMGLSFEQPAARIEDCLQDVVVEAVTRGQSPHHVLVVEPCEERRAALVQSAIDLGHRATGVASALDAVQTLVAEACPIDTVLIEAGSQFVASLELAEFLATQHPRVRRILIGSPEEVAAAWTAEATGDVHAAVELPCDGETLHRVLHRLEFTPDDGKLT